MSPLTAPTAHLDIQLAPKPITPEERIARMQSLGFGKVFTEYMVVIPYSEEGGWGRGVLRPYGPIQLDPAASVLHYGQAIFEGFKAYRQPDGHVKTFRPEANANRFNASARRLAMPEIPVELFVEAADTLISQERDWVPSAIGESLYLRPFMIATAAELGVKPSNEYLFIIIASPSGAYFAQGVKPVTVWISENYVRAAPGGTGSAKCAGNYAASLIAQKEAKEAGCDQVVWLDAVQRRYVEEMGGMNIFFVYQEAGKTVVVTPVLTGTLLPGITRLTLLELAKSMGYGAEERRISVEDWQTALKDGSMTEAFACGTAAVITPIGVVKSNHGQWVINGGEAGPVATRLRKALLDLQHGVAPDPNHWLHEVC
jgi:branched-chain amino acid aminotransferase